MKDSGFVISARADLAEVEVRCLVDTCAQCSAKSICGSIGPSKGHLTVRNPLKASVGDKVEIEIPENRYNRALILIFSTLLLCSLLGMGLGHVVSTLFSLSSQEMIILGFFISLSAAGLALFCYFRHKNRSFLYPVITNIIHKGGRYE